MWEVAGSRWAAVHDDGIGMRGSLCPAWVLPSETGSGYVLRLHETAGRRGTAKLRLARPAEQVTLVDFREQELGAPPQVDETTYSIDHAP